MKSISVEEAIIVEGMILNRSSTRPPLTTQSYRQKTEEMSKLLHKKVKLEYRIKEIEKKKSLEDKYYYLLDQKRILCIKQNY